MTPDLDRLADAVKNRRIQLNLSIRRAAEAADVSKDTWMRVESGDDVRHMTYDKVEAALGWTVGSCRKIMEGEEAVLLDLDVVASSTAVSPEKLEGEIGTAVQSALIATADDLTAAQIRQINEQVIELLRARGILPPAE